MNIDLSVTYYYIVNEDLKMSKGKIAAQVSHVAMQLTSNQGEHPLGRAIVLKAPEKVLQYLKDQKNVFHVNDAGLTEIPTGSLTCVGFKASDVDENIMKLVKVLKLL